ncbi:MAG: sugar phosphate isomerase/epimerase family protein [Phycisphaerae bacterium]|nr:sugar phosphate isomerase/epimerase family protein [Phycisphaerae bacterium]
MSSNFGIGREQLQARLGFSTIAMPGDKRVGGEDIAMIREAGISRIEICGLHDAKHYDYKDRKQLAEIKSECEKQGVSIVSVHAPCPDYGSSDEEERVEAVKETIIAGHAAAELGAGMFVVHFGVCERSEKSVNEVLDGLGDTELKITIENLPQVPDLREHVKFIERIDCERFGLTIDIGHPWDDDGANPFTKECRAREALAQCGSHVVHLHLHDCVLNEKRGLVDHFPPFSGQILWDEVFLALNDVGYGGEYMFEAASDVTWPGADTGWVPLEETITRTAAFPAEFFSRYGE